MKVSLEARNFSLTEAISAKVEKMVFKSLEKYSHIIVSVIVVMDFMRRRKSGQPSAEVKIKVEVPGPDLVAENKHYDLYEAVDGALDKIVDQMQKKREK